MNLNASDTLELVTADAADIDVLVSYKDEGSSPAPTRSQVKAITTAATTTICSAPNPATAREVESISIRNKDTTTCTVTVQFNPGTGSTVEVYETLLEWKRVL